MQDKWVIPALVGVGCFGIGVVVGYNLRKKEAKEAEKYVSNAEAQLQAAAEEIHSLELKVEELSIAEGQRTAVAYHEITPSEEAMAAAQPVATNVFDEEDWNWEEENEERTVDAPYVLHISEWEHQEKGYPQRDLVWYHQDKVLVDEQNMPVPNPERVCGHLNFGHGSGDPHIVYIRNDKLQAEYCISRDMGSYAVEVLGAEIEDQMIEEAELQHSHRVPKFRLD